MSEVKVVEKVNSPVEEYLGMLEVQIAENELLCII